MAQKLTPPQMEEMYESLQPLLKYSNRVGYIAARNARRLRTELTEYIDRKGALMREYGTEERDEDGNPTGRWTVSLATEEGQTYLREIQQYMTIEHEVDIMRLPFDEAEGQITGQELLDADWMFED